MRSPNPIVQFYRLIEQARPPQWADRSAAGTLPTRAYRYCDAVTSAAGFGWWAFCPLEMMLLWDGSDIYWQYAGVSDWLPLMPAAQFPNFASKFNASAPIDLQDCSPPFLTALPEPGTLQLWSGLMARTVSGWHLLVRSPANLPLSNAFNLYEGIVATDNWFGPLFTVLRLNRTHVPIKLRADYPLLQIQPVARGAYGEDVLSGMTVADGMKAFQTSDWEAYRETIVVPNSMPDRPFGRYASLQRRRRQAGCPGQAQASLRPASL